MSGQDLMVFRNEEFGEIRTVEENGAVLFCGADVAKALGYQNPSRDVQRHCKNPISRCTTDSVGRQQEMLFIPESDLYRLIFSSKLPTAERFTDWVTQEVLPSIRKHGAYMTPNTLDRMITSPEFGIKLLTALKEEQDKRKALEIANSTLTVQNQIMQPKAEYFDELVDRNLLTSLRETAKELGVRESEFIRFLVDKKYLYRDKKGKLTPYANKNAGLFEVKECFNEKTNWSGTQTMVTPKGRETFRLLMVGVA